MTEEELMACAQAGYEAMWFAKNGYNEKVAIPTWADLGAEELDFWLEFATAFEAAIPPAP
jgi:hypothetical protein